MDVAERFARALTALDVAPGRVPPELLPGRLVHAAALVLPVAGVGLSVHGEEGLRIPLAASSECAAIAERLEFTVGSGPCHAATDSGLPVVGTAGLLADRWPILHDLLVAQTAIRSIVALPLPGRLRGIGDLDLYCRDPAGPALLDVAEAHRVAALVAAQLEAAVARSAGTSNGEPAWLDTPTARRRHRVWTTAGMVIAALRVPATDALALLRGHAYARDRTVDDLAEDILERRIAPAELYGDATQLPTGPPPVAGAPADRQPSRRQRTVARVVGSACRDDPAAWDGHVLLLHRDERERRAGLTTWVARGLELGEKVICTELPAGPGEPLAAVLQAGGVDAAAAVERGQLLVLPVPQFYPPEGQRDLVERALAEGFAAVRLSAAAGAAPTGFSAAGCRETERRLDELVDTMPVSAMCQYPRATTTGARLRDAVAAHLTGVHESALAVGGNSDGLILRGDVDLANADVFAAVLAAADRVMPRALCLDLAAVTHLDAGAGRRLTDATRRFRAAGGQVLLVAPQPPVEHTLRSLDLGDLPGMQLVGGDA